MSKLTNVEAILAIDSNNGLSKNGSIPWKSKTDLNFFRSKTTNNVVIMGSKTLLSLPNSQPLKNRKNIVVTNDTEKYSNLYKDSKINVTFLNLEHTIQFLHNNKDETIFIIGGNQIYNILLPYCSVIWLTKIKNTFDCDLIFNYNISIYNKEIIYEDDELEIMRLN